MKRTVAAPVWSHGRGCTTTSMGSSHSTVCRVGCSWGITVKHGKAALVHTKYMVKNEHWFVTHAAGDYMGTMYMIGMLRVVYTTYHVVVRGMCDITSTQYMQSGKSLLGRHEGKAMQMVNMQDLLLSNTNGV